MAERNEFTRPLGAHNPGNSGYAEDVTFFHSTGFHGIITLTAHRNTAAGYGRPRRHRLSTDVDHDGIAILVNMCKRVHKNTYFPKPQFGKVQTGQFRHSPPSPRRDKSEAFTGTSAISDGRTRSKIVRLAYMTQPGRPTTGRLSSV